MVRKRRTPSLKTTIAAKRRKTANRKKGSNKLVNLFVPLFFIFCILFGVGTPRHGGLPKRDRLVIF